MSLEEALPMISWNDSLKATFAILYKQHHRPLTIKEVAAEREKLGVSGAYGRTSNSLHMLMWKLQKAKAAVQIHRVKLGPRERGYMLTLLPGYKPAPFLETVPYVNIEVRKDE